jgi:predicted PurR-regulated permease PerM
MTAAASQALVYSSAAALVAVLVFLLWYALDYVLLAFLGVLLALLLRAPANWLARRTGLAPGIALVLVALGLLALLGAGGYFFGNAVADQAVQLSERLPGVVNSILDRLRSRDWGQRLLEMTQRGDSVSGTKVVSGALRFAGSTLTVIADAVIVIFFAAFLAAQPAAYVDGLLRLVPARRRQRAGEVLGAMGIVLQRWLVGQSVLMLMMGLLTFAGLTLLKVPLALPLALLSGLLYFVPYLGAIASAIPAILIGLSVSGQMAAYVVLLFAGLHAVEGYLVEPLIQRKAVYLPPALILFSQVLLALLDGPLGLVVATPLAAALVVAVKMLYVEDVVERTASSPGCG